jgi:hypothetical protein
MAEKPLDLGSPEDVRKRNNKLAQQRVIQQSALRGIMSTRQGREFMFWLLTITYSLGHTNFHTNALSMAFRAGEQNIGVQLLGELTKRDNFDLYVLMLKEAGGLDNERHDTADGDDGADPTTSGSGTAPASRPDQDD